MKKEALEAKNTNSIQTKSTTEVTKVTQIITSSEVTNNAGKKAIKRKETKLTKNENATKGGELNMKGKEKQPVETAVPVTFPIVDGKDRIGYVRVDNNPKADNKTTKTVDNKSSTSNKTTETTEKTHKKKGFIYTRKEKIATAISGALLVGAALAAWGIQEATENDNTNLSNTHVMDAGETFEVGPNSMVSGDISINGIRYFDDSPNTGLIVEFQKGAKVTAPYGATVKENIANQGLMDEIVKEIKGQTNILHPEITEIDTITFPGGNPQGK
jgi:hypothetical protein